VPESRGKWVKLVMAPQSYLANFPPSPYTCRKYVMMLVMLLWSVSYGNNLKLLKFSIFEVFSCYPWLHFILSTITMCKKVKLCLM
jgi:hypothetical protein